MESLEVETRGDIAIMKMQHGKASALDLEFTQEIMDTLGALARGPTSAVVLTGSSTIFSAGVDLIRLQSGGTSYIERFVPLLSKLVLTLLEFPRPLIAAINGHAVAGGCVRRAPPIIASWRAGLVASGCPNCSWDCRSRRQHWKSYATSCRRTT